MLPRAPVPTNQAARRRLLAMNPPDRDNRIDPPVPAAGRALVARQAAEPVACWNEIGVYGQRSCAELSKFVHCRNCPVFSAAANRFFDRGAPEGYRQELTQHLASTRQSTEAGSISAVFFRLDQEWLAFPTRCLQEATEHRPIHSLPHRRSPVVLGLVNIRGELLICISLAHLLDWNPRRTADEIRREHRRLLVVHLDGSRFALPADEISGPHRFHQRDLKVPPGTSGVVSGRLVQGILEWENMTVGCIHAERLFTDLNRNLA